MTERIVFAYDGSPEGTNAISRLANRHHADIVTLTLEIGAGASLDGVRDQAIGRGAARAHVLDVHEEFAREVVIPAARAGTFGPGTSVTALLLPVLAKKLVDVARIEKAAAVAFVTRGEDDRTLEGLIAALDPKLSVIVMPADGSGGRPAPPQRPVAAASLSTTEAHVDLVFERGVPTAINGITMRLPELLDSLTTIAAEHGITGGDHPFVPAAIVLHSAYAALGPSSDGSVRLRVSQGSCVVCEDVKLEM
jgi:argininosuccinate synthase